MSTPTNWGNGQHGQGGPGQQPGGFGPSSGYGQSSSQQGGYGQAPQQGGGYGQSSSGYGQPSQQGGYGQSSGYGQQTSSGYGQSSSGYGQQTLQSGYGQPTQQGGYGQQAGSGFGAPPSPNASGAGMNPYAQPTATSQGYGAMATQGGAPAKKKPGMGLWIGLGAGALVLLLVLGAVIGEFVTRGNVNSALDEKAAAISLTSGDSNVEGSFTHTVDGFSYLMQQLGGSYEHIAFTGNDLTAGGQPYEASFDLYNVPSDFSTPAERVEARTHLPADSVLATFQALILESEEDVDAGDTEGQLTLNDGSMTLFYDYPNIDSSFTYTYEVRAEGGKLIGQMTDSKMVLFGTEYPIGGEDPVEISVCQGLEGATTEVTEAKISPEGIDFAWNVTGDAATLDNLSAIGNCMSSTGLNQ